MRIRPIFAWFDLWVGLFIDRPRRRLYFFPIPTLGIVVEWGPRLKSYDAKNIHVTFNGKSLKFEDAEAPGIRISNCVAGGDIVAINSAQPKRDP